VKRAQRLRSSADFRRVRDAAGRGQTHPLLVLYAAPNELSHTRVGVTVSRRVGSAVVRNRVRRRIREASRLLLPRLARGHDLLFVARPASAAAAWSDVCQAVEGLVRRAGLVGADAAAATSSGRVRV
jgi:ribonuclease P protein component